MEQHAFLHYGPVQVPDTAWLHPAQSDLAYQVCTALQEPQVSLMQHILNLSSGEYLLHTVSRVRDIQARGGMMDASGERLRTPGGLFFYLVKQDASPDQRKMIFKQHNKDRMKASKERKREVASYF